jgi:serine/threonine protein kinase
VVLGAGYGPSADLWSLACTLFELLTGEYLFDPKQVTPTDSGLTNCPFALTPSTLPCTLWYARPRQTRSPPESGGGGGLRRAARITLLHPPAQARAGGRVQYTQEEDLLALHQELRGPMPREVRARARLAKRFFQPDGRLRHIAELKIWPLERVLAEKYRMPPPDAAAVAGFLLPMLELEPARRPSAAAMRAHPFLADHA